MMPKPQKKPRRSPQARNDLIEPLLQPGHNWVESFVRRKYARHHPDQLDELIQIGYEALIHAADLWEEREGKFYLYSQNFIRASIRSYLKNLHSPVRVPAHAWKRDDYLKPVPVGLDALDQSDLHVPTPEDELIDRETLELLMGGVDELPERERYILEAHFGFNGEPRSLRQIAKELGISPQRTHQVQQRALKKLREILAEA